jgi:hypothetical protein
MRAGQIVYIGLDTAGVAESTTAEELIRTGVCGVMSAIFLSIRRPWARAVAIAFAVSFVLSLIEIIQFEVIRGR